MHHTGIHRNHLIRNIVFVVAVNMVLFLLLCFWGKDELTVSGLVREIIIGAVLGFFIYLFARGRRSVKR